MKLQQRQITWALSSVILIALSFRIALVTFEIRGFNSVGSHSRGPLDLGMKMKHTDYGYKHAHGETVGEIGGTVPHGPSIAATTLSQKLPFALTISDGPECVAIPDDDVNFTLVTQCDESRIPMIAQLCLRWTGPLSAAVFTHKAANDVLRDLVNLGCRKEQITLSSLSPSMSLTESAFPVNQLRNIAVRGVKTSHMVYVDVDFIPSLDLEATLHTIEIRRALAEDYKHSLVIPAFEYFSKRLNCSADGELLADIPRLMDDLIQLYDRGEATMFHDYWPSAHDTTDYKTWTHQSHGSLLSIPCIKSYHYEPYLVLRRCKSMPPFQENFTGYGFNKASFTMHLQAAQYHFSQIGGVFCIHFPHAPSKAKQAFSKNKHGRKGQRLQMEKLVKRYAQWLKETYGHEQARVPYCNSNATNSNEDTRRT